ncbi:hypothetical protein PT285_10390 [Lactobacillus sp. ESL0791]|uniref:hypothetical protein n=1 Tax=Lactobacillus sp. ESL0791 TaxID=2983234 RepID=UPI0023F9CAD6|nr:hypothetical protein [Lactobacillus sp. ESL0791]MDF7639808.1 hypothetical protein [Lactobacillus sp. ESL0791]
MKQQNYRKKIIFWLRFTGWFCLFPASIYLYVYQLMRSAMLLVVLGIIVLFAVYLLTTATSERWTDPSSIVGLMIFTIFFAPLILLVPLYFAYRNAHKLKE